MDLFTQNLINRTKQRQEQMSSKIKHVSSGIANGKPDGEQSQLNPSKSTDTATPSKEQEIQGKENDSAMSSKLNRTNLKTSVRQLDPTSPLQATRKTRFEALAYKINDWEDDSGLASKQITSTPEKNSRGMRTPSKTPDQNKAKSTLKFQAMPDGFTETKKKENQIDSTTTLSQNLTPVKVLGATGNEDMSTPYKSLVLDKSVLQSLESQGFTPTESRSRLIYEFEKEQEDAIEEESANSWTFAAGSPHKSASPLKSKSPHVGKFGSSSSIKLKTCAPFKATSGKITTSSPDRHLPLNGKPARMSRNSRDGLHSVDSPSSPNTTGFQKSKKVENRPFSVQQLAAQFDSPRSMPKDPAEMTILERKALFERNQSPLSNLKQQAAKTNNSPSRTSATSLDAKKDMNRVPGIKSKSITSPGYAYGHTKVSAAKLNQLKELEELQNRNRLQNEHSSVSPKFKAASHYESPRPKKLASSSSGTRVELKAAEEFNLDENSTSVSKPFVNTKLEQQQSFLMEPYAGIHQVRPIRVSPPKPGKLYPCLSDIESVTENENESESDEQYQEDTPVDINGSGSKGPLSDLDSSFTIEILGRAGLSQFINTPKRKLQDIQPDRQYALTIPELKKNVSDDDVTDISDLLDEALDDSEESVSPKQQKREDCEQITLEDEGLAVSLFHSVTSYRQQKEKSFTPMKQIVRNPEVRQSATFQDSSSKEHCEISIHQQIRSLQDEIKTQQNVMAQACQALNLCRATAEFSGSTEQVEGEKLLLISSQKKQAAMNEIQRLKSEATIKMTSNQLASRGTLSFSNIGLPLKREFLTMLPKGGGDVVHYFIVLIHSRGQVIPLQMLSTVDGIQDGVLRFPNLVQLSNLPADFDVTIEVYALQTRKEKMNHETKYHIRKDSNKMRLTPKKQTNKQDTFSRTPISIATGSSAVNLRSSSFGLVGISNITPKTLRKLEWTLEKVPSTSPIDGRFQLKIQSHTENLIEERGFLTVFEDVGGFGSWHRRWCLLSNDQLLFWKYPDDEKLKEPQYFINLRKCITEHVDAVSNDVCARPNTFLLVTVRPPEKGDKDSLVMTCYSQQTALRHLISADLKAERQVWCTQINRVLANLRVWDTEVNSS